MPATRLGSAKLKITPDGIPLTIDGGDLFLEVEPIPHVRYGSLRFPLSQVDWWQLPRDVGAERSKKK